MIFSSLLRNEGAGMAGPTDEADGGALRLDFDRRLMLRFRGSVITSDGGLLAYPRVGRPARSDDNRGRETGGCTRRQEPTAPLGRIARQSVFGPLAGYEDVNDAERLCSEPACVGWSAAGRQRVGLPRSARWAASRPSGWLDRRISPLSPTYGAQEDSAYDGHFGCTATTRCSRSTGRGDLERCALRSDNVCSADGWR
jgi:hypothetical protein